MSDAMRLLTIFPARRRGGPALPRTVVFFPVVGLLVGAAWALPGFLFEGTFPSNGITAALVLVVDAVVTRGQHLAALANVADGAASRRRGDEGIAIMRDPVIGAVGASALIIVCLTRYGALTFAADFPFRLFAAPVAGRMAMVFLLWWLTPLQDGSIAHQLGRTRPWLFAATCVVAVVAALPSGGRGVGVVVAGVAAAVPYGLWWQERFGELGRDGIGAIAVIAETLALVMLSAR